MGYDPMNPAPRAVPTGQGSGRQPATPGVAPRPPGGTNSDRKATLDDIVGGLHRPLPGSGDER